MTTATRTTAHHQAAAQLESVAAMAAALAVDYDRLEELRDAADAQASISRGTHRTQDLVPAYLDALAEHDADAYAQVIVTGAIPAHVQDDGDESEWWDSDEAGHLLETLFDALDLAAPDNLYFGTHPGDSSDLGFWLDEETADELAELEEAAGDCESREEAENAIHEDALSLEFRSAWQTPGEDLEPAEYRIVLCTGGPHVEMVGELDADGGPDIVRVLFRDGGESGELFDFDHEAALAYARCIMGA